jgi:multidrug/hemolysin transport system permease protein
MNAILELSKRNLKLFFRSKSEVFFSFLSVLIILGLYVLFLSDLQVSNLKQQLGDEEGIKALVNSWVMAGIIAVSTITLSIGALGRMVDDKETKKTNEFLVSPIKRSSVFISYAISTIIIAFIISIFLLIISQIYIVSSGGELLSLISFIKVIGIIILCVLSSASILIFFVSFFENERSFSVFATIIGTLVGFVTGAYIPIGLLPKGLQIVSNLLPVSQGASMLRKIFLDSPASIAFKNANATYINEYFKMQGITLYLGDFELKVNFMIFYIFLSIIIFSIISIIRFKKMKNK